MVQAVLLLCGILALALYVATDVLGGLRYPGYDFASRAISELGAVGAPTSAFVGPLFFAAGVLFLLFGLGVLSVARRGRALRVTGAFLVAYAAAGLIGFTSAPMQQRGAGSLATDLPHIVTGIAVVLLLLASIAVGGIALGRRFRAYSFATIAIVLVFSMLLAPYVPRLAAGEPTPWLGVIERVVVYAPMLWLAMLAIALLRRPSAPNRGSIPMKAGTRVEGMVTPGFEEVRIEFERNFAERGDIGAAVAAYWHGQKVVDLWGGIRVPGTDAPWNEDTMVPVASTTKGLASMTVAVVNAHGWLDYDAPVARYWPEFAQNGKATITVRQLLNHEAGLVLLDEPVTIERLRDLDEVARLLARQTPAWVPGTKHGYHAMTIGLYMQELIRRVDPAHRTLGRFFREEIAGPLGADFYIGLPPGIADERIAVTKPLSMARAILALPHTPPDLLRKLFNPWSLLRRSMRVVPDLDYHDRRSLEVEIPAGNGVGTARGIARAYSAFAEGGSEVGLTPQTFARITALPPFVHDKDVVVGVPGSYWLGFLRPTPWSSFGSSPRAFGTPGAGGSFAFADPDGHVGYAYVMNKLNFWLFDDPREKALRDALYRALARRPAPVRALAMAGPLG